MSEAVSILLPHFRTEEMVRLCLRCIRKYTHSPSPYQVIVVDNGSGDHASLAYLRSVPWIRLLVREPEDIDPDPNVAHREALQLGLDACDTKYVLSLHTDAFVLREDWLSWMLSFCERDELVSAVGTYKFTYQAWWRHWLTDLKHNARHVDPSKPQSPYIRSHCALYRRDVMDELGLGFKSQETAGRELFFTMLAQGYRPRLLSSREMSRYVAHINHGTMVFNPDLCERRKTVLSGASRVRRYFDSDRVQAIYQDAGLDR